MALLVMRKRLLIVKFRLKPVLDIQEPPIQYHGMIGLEAPRRTRGGAIVPVAAALMVALVGLAVFLSYGVTAAAWAPPISLALVIVALLLLIASHYATSRAWLFSTGFWIAVTIGFYIVLKCVVMVAGGDGEAIVAPLAGTALFLAGYAISAVPRGHARTAMESPRSSYRLSLGGIWVVAAFFLGFQLFGVALSLLSGGSTVLEISNATQNGGASYLYRIPLLANAFYMMLLDSAYRERRHVWLASAASLLLLAIAVASSSRFQVITLVLWNLYFYNRYVRSLSIVWLAVLTPPLVFVVVLFGYVRNIGVGDLGVLLDALVYFQDNSSVIIDLFMARLDMLPQMAKGFALYSAGTAPHLDGMSYVYSLLHAIPRSVWPDKPPLTAALLTAISDPGPFADGVLFYPSIVVEALFNLGWAGIVLAGLGAGALARGYDALLNSGSLIASTWALLFFTFPMGLFNEGFHSNFIGNILYVSVLYGIAVGMLRLTRAIVPRAA